jgi:hypothetical protein
MSHRIRNERHARFELAIHEIDEDIYVRYRCAICNEKKGRNGRELIVEYMRPKHDMIFFISRCCGTLVCPDCSNSGIMKLCHACFKHTKVNWDDKRGGLWKRIFRRHALFQKTWDTKPLLGLFCRTNFNGSWHDMMQILQEGIPQKIQSFEIQYSQFVQKITLLEYLSFGLSSLFKCVPFFRRTSSMLSWLDVSKLICQNVVSRQYILLRRRNLFNMFLNGIVKMLAKKCCDERVVKISGKTKIRTKFFFFHWILKRVLSKRLR